MERLGIIGAEQQEIDKLLELLENKEEETRASMKFYTGTIHGSPVVLVRCGIGKVNAAACAQMLIDCYQVKMIVNTGAAGSLDAQINIGDIVVSSEVIQHDLDCTDLGYAPGVIPDTGLAFAADEQLKKLALEAGREALPDITLYEGRILTGDQFISGQEKKDWLAQQFRGLCAEMEGGAIAQVCTINAVPFLILRAISDKADGSATMDYPQFSRMAAVRSAKLTEKLIIRLSRTN